VGATGDVFQLVDEQVQAGQQILNVYFYKQAATTSGNGAEQLVTSWIDQFLNNVLAFQSDDVTHLSVSAKNLFNDTEAYTELISSPGVGASNVLPTFNAVGFRLIGDNAAVRDGQKRFAGLDESAVQDGVITSSGYVTLLDGLAEALTLGLLVGLAPDVFVPVVVKRILDGTTYRLPENSGEAVLSNVLDALWNPEVTSQTSRKIGRGA
jgi:hypothetical protein